MSYSIHITATAERDILRAADYIKFTLKNPTAAEHLLDADPNGERPENAIIWQQLKELRKKNVNWSVIS